ncbi:uncharacterized protein LOC110533775 [Oncorhynchus mykiss]|uniref:Ciliary neurotrophic factor n=1 Tax=Oncorhynchus mykiss TaxID=8022 RepID=A0A8C7UIB5_ONCMY|nr:uncharacterized protein LOC110533775 [Oncorhynchus mykiss]
MILQFSNHSSCLCLFQMSVWWQVLFLQFFLTLSCVYQCCASPPGLLKSYSYSLKSIRCTHTRVQQLLRRYKEEQLDNKQFEDRSLEWQTLPSLSTDFYHWLQMKDWERLSAASRDLHTFWAHLDMKRREIEREEVGQGAAHRMGSRGKPKPSIPERIQHILTDLRDLMTKVNFQLRCVNSSNVSPTSPPALTRAVSTPSSHQAPSKSLWTSRLEGYVILRDLERYLTKLARDFILLKTKHRGPPGT